MHASSHTSAPLHPVLQPAIPQRDKINGAVVVLMPDVRAVCARCAVLADKDKADYAGKR